MPESKALATGSFVGQRTAAAAVRATDAHLQVAMLARKVAAELDEITLPGVPVEIDEEDSLVTTIAAVIAVNS